MPPEIPAEAIMSFLRGLSDYVVLRNHDVLANLRRGSDVDLLVRDLKEAERRMIDTLGPPSVCLSRSHFRSYHYEWGRLDLFSSLEWRGAVYADLATVLEAAGLSPIGLPKPCLPHEALACWLTSLLWEGTFKNRYRDLVLEAARREGTAFQEALIFAVGSRWGQRLFQAAVEGRPEVSVQWASPVRRWVWVMNLRRDALGTLRRWLLYWAAAGRRMLDPPVPWVALLGTDGSGKTALAGVLSDRFVWSQAVTEVRVFHWRPGVLRPAEGNGGPVTDPHAKPAHGPFKSMVKLMFLLADWWLGYWSRLAPLRARGCLVVFDRHYLDMLVDPRRYRYGGPMGLARFAARLVPLPDLTVVLDAPPDVSHSRKQEVPLLETARQREAYLDLARRTPGARVVDASRPIHEVAAEVEGIIFGLMAERTRRRLGL